MTRATIASELAPEVEELVIGLPPLVTISRAAEHCGVTPRTIRRWLAGVSIRRLRPSGAEKGVVLIPRSEFARLLHGWTEEVG